MIQARPMVRAASLGLLLLSGCTGPADDGNDGALASLPTWELSELPLREVSDDGTPERVFSRITPARLSSGDLLVADGASKELRVFGDGAFLTRLSRQGDGPGELQDIQRISLAHDTVFVMALPMVSRHINSFTSAGFLARFRLQAQADAPPFVPIARLTSGEFLVEEGRGFTPILRPPPMGQLVPDSVTLGLFRPAGSDSIDEYLPLGRFFRRAMVPFAAPGPIPFSMTPFTLGPRSDWTVSGDLVWVLDGASGGLRAFNGLGEMVVETTIGLKARPFDAGELERAKAAAVAGALEETQRAAVEALYDAALRPAAMPLLDALVPGPAGEVWVRRFALDGATLREFLVVNRQGQILARVSVPADVTVHQVGEDFLIGVRRDTDGVESVVEFGLTRR